MKVYFISGLAADSRVFKYIQLPKNCEAVHLHWIDPLQNESLKSYSLRLAEKIDANEAFAIVGLSMGGMIASEISHKLKPAITILISSISSSKQLPSYFKIGGKLKLHKLIPISLVKSAAIAKRFFSAETDEDKMIIKQIIKDSDASFIRWAMDAILKWKNEISPSSYIHIHGTKDGVLPIQFVKPTHIIPRAGHLMIMTNAKQLNEILEKVLVR